MATFKPILNSKPKKDGTHTILLRITENRKHKYLSLDYSVREKDWNANPKTNNVGVYQYVRKSHIHHKQINDHIDNQIKEAKCRIEKVNTSNPDTIRRVIKGGNTESFFKFAEQVANNIKSNPRGYGNWKKYNTVINKLAEYLKGEDLLFDDITYEFLDNYKAYLYSIGNRKNTINSNLKTIRAILYKAIKAGKFEQAKNPFFRYEIEAEKSRKEALTVSEIDRIIDLDLPENKLIWHVRNYFLLSFYLHGIRVADFIQLKVNNIQEGRVVYRMDKTGGVASIKIHDKAKEILSHYFKEGLKPYDYIFPILDNKVDYTDPVFLFRRISAKNALINKYLKKIAQKAGIDKNVSFHTARRSFANVARSKIADISKIQKMLGHSSIKITEIYLDSLTDHSLDVDTDKIYGE